MDKDSILYVGGFELPDKNAAAHRVINNAKILKDLGYNVSFIGISKDIKSSNILKSGEVIQGFESWSIPYPKNSREWIKYISDINYIKTVINSSNKKFSTIICYNFHSLAFLKLMNYCNNNNLKIISDCTEWYDYKINSVTGFIKYIDSEIRMKILNKHCHGLICISEYLYNYYTKVRNKIILPPLTDIKEKEWNLDSTHESDVLNFVYAGSPGRDKDKINWILDSLMKIDNISEKVKFNVIGISRDDYLLFYPEYINKINQIDDFVYFYGKLPHENVLQMLKNGDFSVFVRENKRLNMAGFPTKFVESISCGTPLITNNTSDLDKYLVEGKNGYWLTLEDDNKTTQKLREIISLPKSKIIEMKNECRKSNLFDYRNYEDLVKDLLSKLYN